MDIQAKDTALVITDPQNDFQLMEQGFAVSVVKDATAAAQHPELGDGYQAAPTNFGFLAESVITTRDAVDALRALRAA